MMQATGRGDSWKGLWPAGLTWHGPDGPEADEGTGLFSKGALAWVDAIVWAIAAAWVLLLGLFLYLAINSGDPGLPLLLLLMLVGGAVAGLLMLVMRALLLQATGLRTDMEAVI